MWMRRVAWCLCFDSERRGGGGAEVLKWAKHQGTLSETSELLWVLLRYLECTKKGNAWGGLTFHTKHPFYTRRGAIIRLFAPVRGAITWEKGQKQCSALGPPPQDWLLTWVHHWCWYAWSHAILSPWTYWDILTQFSDRSVFPPTEVLTWSVSWMDFAMLLFSCSGIKHFNK